jgi:hypothetical protein
MSRIAILSPALRATQRSLVSSHYVVVHPLISPTRTLHSVLDRMPRFPKKGQPGQVGVNPCEADSIDQIAIGASIVAVGAVTAQAANHRLSVVDTSTSHVRTGQDIADVSGYAH